MLYSAARSRNKDEPGRARPRNPCPVPKTLTSSTFTDREKAGTKLKRTAENAAVGHPKKCLRVQREGRGKCSRAEPVAGPVAQVIVLAGGQRFLHRDGSCGQPFALREQMQAVLCFDGKVAHPHAG